MRLSLGEFPHHRPKVRARIGGLYHPIVHMNPSDMKALGLACGSLASVEGLSNQNAKDSLNDVSSEAVVVAIAWPQAGCKEGQARLSRLLRRCLVHGRSFEFDSGLKHVKVDSVDAPDASNLSDPTPLAASIEVSIPESTREQLTFGRDRTNSEFPAHLEGYIAHALMGRIVSVGTGFSCPVLGVAHTFWVSSVTMKATQREHQLEAQQSATRSFVRIVSDTSVRIIRHDRKETSESKTSASDEEKQSVCGVSTLERNDTKPDVSSAYSRIGGLETQIQTIRKMIELPLHSPTIFADVGLQPPKGVLMYGPPGTGKTMIARAVATTCDATFLKIDGAELLSNIVGESELALRKVFNRAHRLQPALIFIDEIDALCPRRDRSVEDIDKRMVSTLLTLMDGVDMNETVINENNGLTVPGKVTSQRKATLPPRVVVLAATNRPNALDPAVRRPGRFDREVEIGIPTGPGRVDILTKMLSGLPHALSNIDIEKVASKAHGYVGADLKALCQEAGMISLRRCLKNSSLHKDTETEVKCSTSITLDDLHQALGRITPSAMREVAVEVPSVRWSDIGGQEKVKQRLREAVEWPLQRPEVFEIMGIRPPKGVLLYGPPGCSKTLMAKAVATESGMNFIAVKGPELFNKWVGESERAVAEVFRKARAAAPSVVFFDEIDALASQRGGESDAGGVADRVLSQLLTELDGVRPLKQVVVLAATNRPDLIDNALTRPGRIDRMLYVSPPDDIARIEILKIHLKSTPLAQDVDLGAIAAKCEGLSGAEMASICREASLYSIEEDAKAMVVSQRHFIRAAAEVQPQITPSMLAFFESFGVR